MIKEQQYKELISELWDWVEHLDAMSKELSDTDYYLLKKKVNLMLRDNVKERK